MNQIERNFSVNASFVVILVAAGLAERPDLAGRVFSTLGDPVPGAHALIDSASMREGASSLCPSCYADCRKSAVTDQMGRFRIGSVDPALLFDVLVVADGFRPVTVRKVDPLAKPIDVELTPQEADKLEPKRILFGVVLDGLGKPVAGAKVSAQSFKTDAFSGFSPGVFDPIAVTNLRGEFLLTSTSPITHADLKVEGNGVAPRIVAGRKPEANPQTIKMTAGAKVTGRLIRGGRPVADAMVGLVQVSRGIDQFLGDESIGTDLHGGFTFPNVHPDEDYYIYGLMGSFKDGGAVPVVRIRSGADGATTDVGNLQVIRGHRIKGQVLLSDGKMVPAGTRLMVSREDAWDHQEVRLDPEGRFEISGLPTEKYSLNVSLRGYRLSLKNHSIDSQSQFRLIGTIDQDIDTLKILMEPGSR
jgi:hypothetical protein